MKWVWPISLYWRIRELEAQIATLKGRERELEARVRAQAIAQTSMIATYTAAVASIAATMKRHAGD